jgi:hypothetical protein
LVDYQVRVVWRLADAYLIEAHLPERAAGFLGSYGPYLFRVARSESPAALRRKLISTAGQRYAPDSRHLYDDTRRLVRIWRAAHLLAPLVGEELRRAACVARPTTEDENPILAAFIKTGSDENDRRRQIELRRLWKRSGCGSTLDRRFGLDVAKEWLLPYLGE